MFRVVLLWKKEEGANVYHAECLVLGLVSFMLQWLLILYLLSSGLALAMLALSVDLGFELLQFVVGALAFDIVVLVLLLLTPAVVVIGVIVSCCSSEGCGALLFSSSCFCCSAC